MSECGAWNGVVLILGTATVVAIILTVVTVAWVFNGSRET